MSSTRPASQPLLGRAHARHQAVLIVLATLVAVIGLGASDASAGAAPDARNGVAATNPEPVPAVGPAPGVSPAVVGISGLLFDNPAVVSLVAPRGAGSAFHHTTDQAVESIMRSGLRPGSYATPTSGLSPLQAHIELALNPAGGPRNAVLHIDVAGLRAAGYEIPTVTRVTGANGMAGGGWEMRFPYEIPAEFLKVIR